MKRQHIHPIQHTSTRFVSDQSRVRPFLLLLVLSFMLMQGFVVAPVGAAEVSPVAADLRLLAAKIQGNSTLRVIVGVRSTTVPEGRLASPDAVQHQHQAIARAQSALIQRLAGKNARVVAQYQFIPFLALEADATTIKGLASDAGVTSVQEDVPAPPALDESIPLIGGSPEGTFGTMQRTGRGQTIAILDTGVMKSHAFLAGKVVSEACFSTTDAAQHATAFCTSGSTAAGSGVNCPATLSECDHGTHVAGIAAGKAFKGQIGGPFNGVAKDANLISIQVFSHFTKPECGELSECVLTFKSDQIKGLERVFALRSTHTIAAVNMSLGGGKAFTNCDGDARKAIIDQLASVGIVTVVSSGNQSFTNAVTDLACISTAITVGSTTKLDALSSFTNSSSMVDLLAPGSEITSSVPTSTTAFGVLSGTSMAAPHVAGAWAVLKQHKPDATNAEVLSALQTTGLAILDSRNGVIRKRIKLSAAVNSINPVPVLTAINPSQMEAGFPEFTLTVTGSGFVPSSVVRWKGLDRPTTFVSTTQLKATITKADLAAAGTAQIKVFNMPTGGGLSTPAMFTITPPAPAPAPQISSLNPSSRVVGSGAFTLVVKGTNFVPRSVIRWAGVPRPTTFISATELRATLAAVDVATEATSTVVVNTPAPGGGVSNALDFRIIPPPCSVDEPNNKRANAKVLPFGEVRTYAICTIGDKDVIKIDGIVGIDYAIDVTNVAANLDIAFQVFAADGSFIGTVDDRGKGMDEGALISVEEPQPFFIAFNEVLNNEAASTFTYDVLVTIQPATLERSRATLTLPASSTGPSATK